MELYIVHCYHLAALRRRWAMVQPQDLAGSLHTSSDTRASPTWFLTVVGHQGVLREAEATLTWCPVQPAVAVVPATPMGTLYLGLPPLHRAALL